MFRKIVFAVPALALALFVVSHFAWAQESPVADDGDQNATDASGAINFGGSGSLDATPTTPCSDQFCFSVSGTVNPTVKSLGTGDVTGSLTVETCKTGKSRECCTFTSTETYSFTAGDLDVMLAGVACGKKPSKITAKGVKFEITGGTGMFAGASGSAKSTFDFSEDTDVATFKFKGKLTE